MAVKLIAKEYKQEDGSYAYEMQEPMYNTLSQAKVIQEAALRSGISKGAINASWDAICEVIKAWITEGHEITIPGIGTVRIVADSQKVATIKDVEREMITERHFVFKPSAELQAEMNGTHFYITCYNKDDKLVKRVESIKRVNEHESV